MRKLEQAKGYLKEIGADGWLLYDFHESNPLARQFLEISPEKVTHRRFFYWIPVLGDPVKIVHKIEAHVLDEWPGKKIEYLSWESLESVLQDVLRGSKRVTMEYSPRNAIPYVSKVDAGTLELVRSFGIDVLSSGPFLPYFTAVLSEAQAQSHIRAGAALDRIVTSAWKWIGDELRNDNSITEYDVQEKIAIDFGREGLNTDMRPLVCINAHSADPHYAPKPTGSSPICKGDFILIDLFAKEPAKNSVFGDITRVGVAASHPTPLQQEIFSVVLKARRAATDLVRSRFAAKRRIEGWEVDDAARFVIRNAGYGDYFIHRTGHNIGVSLHGSGANMDNLEMHDVRPILPGTCFSIEPGIYLPGQFGVRTEYDLYIHPDGTVQVVGGEQNEITCLF